MSIVGTDFKTIDLSWHQNDYDKISFLELANRNKFKDLQSGQDVAVIDFLKNDFVCHGTDSRKTSVKEFAENAVVFTRIKVAEADKTRYEDVVLNVKDNALSEIISGKTMLEACGHDIDEGYGVMLMMIHKDRLTPEQMKIILS